MNRHETAGSNAYARPKEGEASEKTKGEALLSDIYDFLGRFISYPSEHTRLAHALWVVHTHLMGCWESTPRIAFLSPEAGSGKTRCLELTELMVPNPIAAVNVSAAYLFRKVGGAEELPTIIYDEADTVFGPRAGEHEDVRGFLNAGHRRGAVAGRCVVKGKNIETEELPCYAAVALAGLGNLPDTVLTRSVIVRMRRRAPTETVEPYRRRVHGPEGEALRARIQEWAHDHGAALDGYVPEMPGGIFDRDADVWEPLLSVAEIVGGEWLPKAHVAAVALVAASKVNRGSLGVVLLSDIRLIYGYSLYRISSSILVESLVSLPESPWADIKGKPLNANGLSRLLRQYEISSKEIRFQKIPSDLAEKYDGTSKGYERGDFLDAWERYLPPLASPVSPMEAATTATATLFVDETAPLGRRP